MDFSGWKQLCSKFKCCSHPQCQTCCAWLQDNWVVGAPLVGSFLAMTLFGGAVDKSWYATLKKPKLNPPKWIFPIVWPILYVMIGWAINLVLHTKGGPHRLQLALILANLVLNYSWSVIFFRRRHIYNALIVCMLIWTTAVGSAVTFSWVNQDATLYLGPYIGWLTFATFLNWRYHKLNKQRELNIFKKDKKQQ